MNGRFYYSKRILNRTGKAVFVNRLLCSQKHSCKGIINSLKKSPHLHFISGSIFSSALAIYHIHTKRMRSSGYSRLRVCLFCCTTRPQSSFVATPAPNPDKVFAKLIYLIIGCSRHLLFCSPAGRSG